MLKQEIQADIYIAMREKAKDERDLLRFIMAQIKQKEVDERKELSDAEVIDILKKEIKQTNEARAIADSTELRWRVDFIERYLPAQLDREQIEELVDAASQKFSNMKECMTYCMKEYGTVCDKKILSEIIRSKF